MSQKLSLALPWGALGVLEVHLHIFPLNYVYFFLRLGVQVHPLHPLGTPMYGVHSILTTFLVFTVITINLKSVYNYLIETTPLIP